MIWDGATIKAKAVLPSVLHRFQGGLPWLPMWRAYPSLPATSRTAQEIMASGRREHEPQSETMPPRAAPAHVEILSPAAEIAFPGQWYEIMDERHFWMKWRTRAFLSQCRALSISTEAPSSVLEIGCGLGVLRQMLEAATSWTVDAMDLNAGALFQSAPGRGRTALYNIHDRAPALAARYDAIILFDVIEHIDDPVSFVRSALYHLKPGGHVFINVPALQSLYSRFDVAVGHCRRYNKATLEAELAKAGIRKIDDRYWGLTMLPLLALRKLWLSLRGNNPDRGATVVQRGLVPPGKLADAVLTGMMTVETGVIANPPLGTSLLYVGQAD
jgi:SAM-dependent methyltransferase